jgi:hypothetical protein
MKISEKRLDEFIEIHRKKHSEVLGRQVALEEDTRLFRLVEIVESENYKMNNEQ